MKILSLTALSVLALCGAANADVSISSMPTQNMSCDAGVCTATAQKAVLNVGDLQTMLAAGDMTVTTGGVAKDIDIDQPLTWSSMSALTLDAQHSVVVKKAVAVSGAGGLTLTTNDGGKKGSLLFQDKGKIVFWDTESSLVINGQAYVIVNTVSGLSSAVAANPSGHFAMASDYDAGADGPFTAPPIADMNGTLERLGNRIAHLTIEDRSGSDVVVALIATNFGIIRDVTLSNVKVTTGHSHNYVATLAGYNLGTITNSHAAGEIVGRGASMGGLVGNNSGTVAFSSAAVSIRPRKDFNGDGGLVGYNGGSITASYAIASISSESWAFGGGLAAFNAGSITDSYALGAVTFHNKLGAGLVGFNALSDKNKINTSYSTVTVDADEAGGFLGVDNAKYCSTDYWDLDTSGVSNPRRGAWKPKDDPGITGLTDAQLKSGLPQGFDPKIWGSNPNINNGYPYLLANPPQ